MQEKQTQRQALRLRFSLQVLLKGSIGEGPLGFLGYCPQENVLWPSLTMKEHLEVFAAIKGLRKADAAVTISRWVGATCVLYLPGWEMVGSEEFHCQSRTGDPDHTG